jgi:HTH-type transcriptional regulator/antitoxin HigA
MFNQETYLNLLSSIAPKKIESEEQYDEYILLLEPLLFESSRTEEEQMVGHLLSLLIEEYEETHYPIPQLEPLEFLKGLMENFELKQKDLVGILGSKGVVSEVINGKREISKAQAKALGQFFNTSYKNFL